MFKKSILVFLSFVIMVTVFFFLRLNADATVHFDSCRCCSHYDIAQNQEIEDIENQNSSSGQMTQANEAAGQLLRIKMEQEDPKRYCLWDSVEDSDIIVVTGVYDRVEDVLEASRTPYSLISPQKLSKVNLDPSQLLMINCPGDVDRTAISNIEEFVKAGGYLFTTDWALLNVLEKSFPGFVEYNNIPTADDVVEVQVADRGNPLLLGVMAGMATPCWWLETSSYPIRILNEKKVDVLITSKEMERKYGEPSIAVSFNYGDGKVVHMTSHFYLQRSDTRYDRQKMDADYYVKEELNIDLNTSEGQELQNNLDGLNLGEIENCTTNQQFIVNVIIDRKESQE